MRTCLLAAFLAGCAAAEQDPPAPFRVGAAAVEITPKPGTPLGGLYRPRAVSGVLDPLYAKALVVEQDGSTIAFVVLDLVTTTAPIVRAARERIARETGLPAERVMIAATHTHSAPQLPRGSLIDDLTRANSPEGKAYVDGLPARIAQAVREAKARLAPARLSAAVGKAEGISFNRRVLRGSSSRAIWQPRKIDPAVERPAGPVDPDVGLLVLEGEGAPTAAVVNFAMHPTSVMGTKVSADYPGALARLLRERFGDGLVTLFANGCCGDLNHGDYVTGTRRTTEQLGKALADAAGKAWPSREPQRTFAPRAARATVTLDRARFTEADVTRARETARRMRTESLGTVEMAEAVCILETAEKKDVALTAEVQAFAFGDDVALVALPGEIFVELGLALKARSPFRYTLIAELANGSIGYVPNREAYPQGNYEVVSARCAAGSGERLVDAAVRLLDELKARR